MKISILTLWDKFTNYGQVLQCYALQRLLSNHGYDAEVTRFIPGERLKQERREKLLKIYPLFDVIKRRIRNTFAKLESTGMKQWAMEHIKYSEEYYNSITSIRTNPPTSDCYIVGSDQVWLQKLKYPDNYVYFLDFGDENIKRIAYAPSFGMKKYPTRDVNELKRLLHNLDAVSVREADGVQICADCGIKAKHVLDPTLLLKAEDYNKLIDDQQTVIGDYIFLYNINIRKPEDIRWNELKTLADKKEMRMLISQGVGFEISNEIFGSDANYEYMTMEKWLSGIKNATFVVASSFHCVVFSVIFSTPFVYAPIKGEHSKGNNRALGLMKQLGLDNRVLNDSLSYEDFLNQEIDWADVHHGLDKLRNESLDYLISNIEK